MKYHPHGSVLFSTFSVEEGLLLLSNPLCVAILKSCLARAQFLYPVTICHFMIESTHVHMVLVVKDPEDVPRFVRHFKTDTAHMFNGLLGRDKRTVWCDGYDSPIVLTPVRALTAIAYLYANPAKDGLEDSISEYPGLSSWKMFTKGRCRKKWKRLRRPQFKALSKDAHTLEGYQRAAEAILGAATDSHEFELTPNAWLEAFNITDPKEQERINARLIERVRFLENRFRRQRAQRGKTVIGKQRLLRQPLDITYQPKRSGRRTCCLSENITVRRAFIRFLKHLMGEARRIYQKWKLGDFSESFPLGLHPPSMPKLAEVLNGW